ncbi:manganese/iron transport system substrate-binding protein [Desulfobotulus alkaliphilus]|uniref:Manganese/iron transport system substrate-binding protein n=1 Tax=Desulfobotulus alkaliphilus TaxID=622671 RepID=A0A562S3J8_9BACT|nr:zinc ABC transporter substrate-binding protein [Desulfobotulus alkaliphilus]TWI75364.1 manganese/iron transport system substrate-binding protein [Desulfobotulus alkaliphilus]
MTPCTGTRRFVSFFLALLISAALMPAAHGETPRRIVASTTQIADFARNITGDRWEVHSILAAGADPHTYTPTPRDAERVANAHLVLQNGLMLEGKNWMETLARASGKPLVTCTDGITPLEVEENGETILDPHAWFSPKNAAVYVRNILKAVSDMDPEGKALFEARAELYLQQLRVLDTWIRASVATIPPERRLLVTSHDAFNYFCREYRFNPQNNYLSLAPVGWSTGGEVGAGSTPARLRQVMESIREMGAPAIFVETSVNPRQIREIATQAGIRVGGALYSDAMGPPGSAGETYIGMMRENTLTIVEALR